MNAASPQTARPFSFSDASLPKRTRAVSDLISVMAQALDEDLQKALTLTRNDRRILKAADG